MCAFGTIGLLCRLGGSCCSLLIRQSRLGGWRAIVLGPSLPQLLGSSQSSGLIILLLGLDSIDALRHVNREIVAIFQQILDSFHFEQRALRRAYYY